MPRISAPTVAAHRDAQRAALLRAAADLVRAKGVAAITPGAVSERAGLTRSSFYDYFPSRDDLLAALALDAFRRWNAAVDEALAGVPPGLPRLRAYVAETTRMAADREHDIAGVLREAELAPRHLEDLMAVHDTVMQPLERLIAELGVPDPGRAAVLAEGVLGAAIRLVQRGADAAATAEDAYALLARGLPPAAS